MQYPVGVRKLQQGLELVVPGAKNNTYLVESYDAAQVKAREVLDAWFMELADQGELPPKPMVLDSLIGNHTQNMVWLFVEMNLEPYLGRSSKLNITLPNLLRKQIDDVVLSNFAYKDRSNFLQIAAINELSGATLTPHFDGLIIKQGDIQVFIQNKKDFKFRVATKIGGEKVVSIEYMWLSVTLPYKYLQPIEQYAGVTYAELIERWQAQQISEQNS